MISMRAGLFAPGPVRGGPRPYYPTIRLKLHPATDLPPGRKIPVPAPVPQAPGLSESDRLETFCDGVFAIAITLLVLEIRVPDAARVHAAGGLLPALWALWPSYLGYGIGFLTIGIMWSNHHAIFQYVRRTDRYFLLVNVVFLLTIAFVPFPTAVLAEYLPEPAERGDAIVLYSAVMVAMALTFNALWWYAVRGGRLLEPDADMRAVRTISRRYLMGPPAYGATLLLAFFAPWASLALHGLLALLYLLPERSR